ncbi:TolC family protein [Paraglaciecola sp.]|uniref:TolC family protein n=1 Tax=Paraglaciecola sp. TaxID=1920173 RepID=UPI003EF854A2
MSGCAIYTTPQMDLNLPNTSFNSAFNATPLNATFKSDAEKDLTRAESAPSQIRGMWWKNFERQQLNKLIEHALQHNFSLKSQLALTKASELALVQQNASDYPSVNMSAGATADAEQINEIRSGNIGLSSSWEVDLWGKLESLQEKAQWDLVSQQAIYKMRLNTVAGTVANIWLNWQAEREKKLLYASQFARTKTALEVIQRRFAMGKNSVTSVWQQQRLLESIKSQQVNNQSQLLVLEQQLISWLGGDMNTVFTLLQSTPEQEVSLSLALDPVPEITLSQLQVRPDLQQAYAKLQAADKLAAAAAAEKFPRLTLRADIKSSKTNTVALFDDWAKNFIVGLTAPIFNGGAIEAKRQQRLLQLEASFADYQQKWLDAILDVQTALINEGQLFRVAEQLQIQLELAQKTVRVVSLKYRNGKATYLALLRAQETSLNLERQQVNAKRSLLANRIKLYREISHSNFSQSPDLQHHLLLTSHSVVEDIK